jgi:transcriptional regulator with XRE-family HTH domain
MKTKNELFMDAILYLIDNGYAANQGDIVVKAGLGPNLISRIKNGRVKSVSDDAIRALCNAFEDLNLDYFRGKSDCISKHQLSLQKVDKAIEDAQKILDANPPHEPGKHSALDDSFLYEKAIEKINEQMNGKYIANLEHQNARLEKEVDEKSETIKILQARIHELEAKLKESEKYKYYIFPQGVADRKDVDPAHV